MDKLKPSDIEAIASKVSEKVLDGLRSQPQASQQPSQQQPQQQANGNFNPNQAVGAQTQQSTPHHTTPRQ